MLATRAPFGRSVEKSWPMPPPCCIVSAASFSAWKMPSRLSGMVPMTKQLNRVTLRSVPAPARIRPAGMKRMSAIASRKRASIASRRSGASAAATARAAVRRVHSEAVPAATAGSRWLSHRSN